MALPILLDCDPGHDDAIAIVLALASPELDVKAITSSAGNQTPEKTLRNVLRMLTLLNRTDIPVFPGTRRDRQAGFPPRRSTTVVRTGNNGHLRFLVLPLATVERQE